MGRVSPTKRVNPSASIRYVWSLPDTLGTVTELLAFRASPRAAVGGDLPPVAAHLGGRLAHFLTRSAGPRALTGLPSAGASMRSVVAHE